MYKIVLLIGVCFVVNAVSRVAVKPHTFANIGAAPTPSSPPTPSPTPLPTPTPSPTPTPTPSTTPPTTSAPTTTAPTTAPTNDSCLPNTDCSSCTSNWGCVWCDSQNKEVLVKEKKIFFIVFKLCTTKGSCVSGNWWGTQASNCSNWQW